MAPTSASWVVLMAVILSVTAADISARPGENVTLSCQDIKVTNITKIVWSRPDLESDGDVFFFRENRLYERYQHRLFRGRVQLKDPGLKDGDVSVILKNVTMNDTGTYRCDVSGDAGGRRKRAAKVQSSVYLKVTPGEREVDKKGGGVGLLVGAVSVGLVVLAGVGLLVWSRSRNQRAAQPAAPEEVALRTIREE